MALRWRRVKGPPRVDDEGPTMIVPKGTEIAMDVHGQLSIRTPGNLVIQDSGHYGKLESVSGSIRIDSGAEVEAVDVVCADTCFVEGQLTAWKVVARSIHLENRARANIVLQETQELKVGRDARLVGNFSSEKELFVLLSSFARQLRSMPLFADRRPRPAELSSPESGSDLLLHAASGEADLAAAEAGKRPDARSADLPDPLFFALVLLEREFSLSTYGPTSQRAIEELIKLLQERDLDTLRLTYRTLFNRVVDPGRDIHRAFELMQSFLKQPATQSG